MQTEHIHSLNLLYITLKLIVVLLEHQVDMISIFQRLTELGLIAFIYEKVNSPACMISKQI